jgi:arylsulfatase A-like enzyme
MTMMTGLPPTVHGVDEDHGLPNSIPTLAERLSAAGWATVGVTDRVPWLDDKYGFARGFDLYRRILNDASLKIDRILTHVDNLDQRPFFLFAHFDDVHSDWGGLPYVAEPEDAERFAGWYTGDFDGCVEDLGCASDWMKAVDDRELPVDEDVVAYVSSLYDAGLATFDRELARWFDALEARGVLDRSVVLVLSDHGEEFREHGRFLHAQRYDECLRVPFLLRTPDSVGGSTDALVCMVDVAPTLLELAGLPPLGLGRSVAGELAGKRGADGAPGSPAEPPVVVLDDGNGIHGLRGERWAVMRVAAGWEVYDLAADPGQATDLAQDGRVPDELPAEVHELVRRVQRERERLVELGELVSDERPGAALTDDERERLRALGYLGE